MVGPTDVGKSSMAKLLLSYATRMQWQPTMVDLDIGEWFLSCPDQPSARFDRLQTLNPDPARDARRWQRASCVHGRAASNGLSACCVRCWGTCSGLVERPSACVACQTAGLMMSITPMPLAPWQTLVDDAMAGTRPLDLSVLALWGKVQSPSCFHNLNQN